MTSLLLPTGRTPDRTERASRTSGEVGRDLVSGRPLTLIALVGGLVAAAGPLLVALALGVVGWYLTDAGALGTPSDGLRVGAFGWLMGHGSGVSVEGVPITAIPLGVTLLCAYVVWRTAHRVGTAVSGHGPDAAAIDDGQRDLTVPVALGVYTAGYVVVAVAATTLAATPQTVPSTPRVVVWSLLLCGLVGGTALAIGSGRAAIWVQSVPLLLRTSAQVARRILLVWFAVATVTLLAAFLLDLSTAANVMSSLHTDAGAVVAIVLVSLLVLPNAAAFSSAYLAGPGFTVGTGTLVTPSAVVLGPLPVFPLLAALPDAGAPPTWTVGLLALPAVVALLMTMWVQRTLPTTAYDEGALRGLIGGVAAGLVVGLIAAVAGGAVGPGRLAEVGPLALQVTLQTVTAFGLGGVVGGVVATWWQRRGDRVEWEPEADDAPSSP